MKGTELEVFQRDCSGKTAIALIDPARGFECKRRLITTINKLGHAAPSASGESSVVIRTLHALRVQSSPSVPACSKPALLPKTPWYFVSR